MSACSWLLNRFRVKGERFIVRGRAGTQTCLLFPWGLADCLAAFVREFELLLFHLCAEPGVDVTAPEVTLLPPSSNECRNQKERKRKKTLVCLATGFYPDHINVFWLVNGEEVTDGVATDSAALRPNGQKFYRISSRLRVAAEDWFNPESVFTCKVSFFNGKDTENSTRFIQGEGTSASFSPDLYKSWSIILLSSLQLQYPGRSWPEVNMPTRADDLS